MSSELPSPSFPSRDPEPHRESMRPFSRGLPGGSAAGLATLGLAATLIARGLAPALPGSRSGIGWFIGASDDAGVWLSQLLAVYGLGLATWLVLVTLRSSELPAWYRLLCVPAVALVVTLSAGAIAEPLRASWSVWLAVSAGWVGCAAAPYALRRPETRAPAFVVGAIALAALIDIGARWVAVRASNEALSTLFNLARAAATVSFALKFVGLVLCAVWLGARRWRTAVPIGLVLVAMLAALSIGAARASDADASWWQVLVARTLAGFLRHPAPMVAPVFRSMVELGLLVAAASLLLAKRAPRSVLGMLGLALISRGMADIPLCGLILTVAGLMTPLVALDADRASASAPGREQDG